MKLSIKEAFLMARQSLPGYRVKVEVKIGRAYSFEKEEDHKINWEIIAGKGENNTTISESDEFFSIALAKVIAESKREIAKSVDDVDIIQEENTDKVEEKENPEIPF